MSLSKNFKKEQHKRAITQCQDINQLREMALLLFEQYYLMRSIHEDNLKQQLRIENL